MNAENGGRLGGEGEVISRLLEITGKQIQAYW